FRALSLRSSCVILAAEVLPPFDPPFLPPALPRATAWGFFRVGIAGNSNRGSTPPRTPLTCYERSKHNAKQGQNANTLPCREAVWQELRTPNPMFTPIR